MGFHVICLPITHERIFSWLYLIKNQSTIQLAFFEEQTENNPEPANLPSHFLARKSEKWSFDS